MKSVWVKRTSDLVFDPWGIDPTLPIGNLSDFDREITAFDSGVKPGNGS